jgi:cytochrome c oxidase subunit 1
MAYVDEYPQAAKLARWEFGVAFLALALGGVFGLVQALYRTDTFREALPINATEYYTVLTGHGVLLALVFTTFSIAALFTWATTRSLERPLASTRLAWGGFWLLLIGTVLAATSILNGFIPQLPFESSDVLFTFYAPLKAHPAFYLGAALIIVGSWVAAHPRVTPRFPATPGVRSHIRGRQANTTRRHDAMSDDPTTDDRDRNGDLSEETVRIGRVSAEG